MDRRTFVGVVASGILAAPLLSEAQTRATPRRIGWVGAATSAAATRFVAAFRDGMRGLGWIEGENLVIEYRWAEANLERLPESLADLLRLGVEVIVVTGTPAAPAAKRAGSTIPIVFGMVGDPVASGIVVSLARPGGNATGWSYNLPEITGKQLALVKEIAPGASRVAVLWNPGSHGDRFGFTEVRAAAQALRLSQRLQCRGSGHCDRRGVCL
jgi:putative tryptophan/tyrosine transport system substrate-binding protein